MTPSKIEGYVQLLDHVSNTKSQFIGMELKHGIGLYMWQLAIQDLKALMSDGILTDQVKQPRRCLEVNEKKLFQDISWPQSLPQHNLLLAMQFPDSSIKPISFISSLPMILPVNGCSPPSRTGCVLVELQHYSICQHSEMQLNRSFNFNQQQKHNLLCSAMKKTRIIPVPTTTCFQQNKI